MGCGCSLGAGRRISGNWDIPEDCSNQESSLKHTEVHIQKPEGWVSGLEEHGSQSPEKNDLESSITLGEGILYRHTDFYKYYDVGSQLGEGTYASVKNCTEKFTDENRAVKMVNLALLDKQAKKDLSRELDILAKMQHKNIVKMFEVFEQNNVVYMVQELLSGGELFEKIIERKRFTETETKMVLNGIASAVAYCHANGVVHRDIKPENVLLVGSEADSAIKVIDFGFAHEVPKEKNLKLICGTPGYVAPEMLKDGGYREQVDNWSMGVIAYIMLAGFPPFNIDVDQPGGQDRLFDHIRKANYSFPSPYWDSISNEAIDLVSKLLEPDPLKRISAKQVLQHEWMYSVRQIEFDARKMWQSAIRKVIVTNRFSIPVLKRMANFAQREYGEDPTMRGGTITEIRKALNEAPKRSRVEVISEEDAVTALKPPALAIPIGQLNQTYNSPPKTDASEGSRKMSIFEVAPDVRKLQRQNMSLGASNSAAKIVGVVGTAVDFEKKNSMLKSQLYTENSMSKPGSQDSTSSDDDTNVHDDDTHVTSIYVR